jgi:formate hydrogenlyase subunit 3/multisubunit Na+/H+ antiporter MnhD subunit
MLRLVLGEFSQGSVVFGGILMLMAMVTMTVGNLGALGQRDIKRMLAYSSVAQVGYMMAGFGLGFGLGIADGIRGSLFHLMTHSAMKSAAFLSAGILIDMVGTREIEKMRGVGKKHPVEASILAIACLSLAGIPGFAGFMSKWWIYRAGLESGTLLGTAVGVMAVVNSVISLGYYLPLIWKLFAPAAPAGARSDAEQESFLQGVSPKSAEIPWGVLPVIVLGVAVMVLGTYPVPVLRAIESAAAATISMLGGI